MGEQQKTIPEQVAEQLTTYFQEESGQTLFANGQAMQEAVLEEILALSQNSAYAQAKGFAQARHWAEFQEQVPLSEYEDYLPYIEANKQVDSGQLIGLETAYYLATTGTTGTTKCFAESHIGALARQLVIDSWNLAVSEAVPQAKDEHVKMLAVVNGSSVGRAQNGKPIIPASGQAGKVLWERAGDAYIFPYAFLEADMSHADRDYLTALYALKEADFSRLYCNNLAYFGILLDAIAKWPQQMIEDIRTGHMTATLRDEDRAVLEASFLADPQRATYLQQLLDQQGVLPTSKIWPKFVFIGTWLSGSAGRMAQDVLRRLPDTIQCISEGYGASEAMLTIPLKINCAYGPAAPFAYFYEFLPLGARVPLRMSEVIDGDYYELIITTYSGLYRYNLHDIVCIRGFTGTTANLEFCCKSTEVCVIQGQAIYAFHLAEMVQHVEQKMGCLLSFYQGFAQQGGLSVAIQPYEATFAAEQFYTLLQASLENCGLKLDKLYVMKKNYRDSLFQAQMVQGKMIHSIKLLTMITEPPEADLVQAIYTA